MSDQPSVVDAVRQRGFFGGGDPKEVAPRTFHVPTMANSTAFVTDDGIVLVDCGVVQVGPHIHGAVRGYTDAPLNTVVYTHGHVDHCMGLAPWLDEGKPRVVGHENVAPRFDRYLRTVGLQEHINSVQFGFENMRWPTDYIYPDTTYRDSLELTIGGERFELNHGKGETDDATWVWAPDRGVLCTGDFWISCVPNCGNPQKVQRYPEEWVQAFEKMIPLGAETLLPGHGPLITGAKDVERALTDAAAYLRSIVDQTLAALNEGLPHDEIVARVKPPAEFADRAYLQPIYDRPEFIVRNLIRLHGGWWDGYASNLMPATEQEQAREIASLAGGADKLVSRARDLADSDIELACHLAEWAALAEPSSRDAQQCVLDLFTKRAGDESSLMGRGIFMHAVRQAKRALGD
ncbi:MAG TPA: alkyl sulfatase dimerization domain-containing protein [Actinomycetota bacterium]|jgi:glyoxylase-like metal-dependent hydrolase (beta-lactamase superfamily II)|nr:alkyl sulfatase dimerization domain-containing protein [Actinomycetota bacterium]